MKKIFLTLSLSMSLLFSGGIPVIDGASIAQNLAEFAKEAMRWTKTIAHHKKQIEAYKKQLATQLGIRDVIAFEKAIEDIYKTKEMWNFEEIDKSFKSNNWLSNKAEELMKKFMSYDYCKNYKEDKQEFCYGKQRVPFENILFLEDRQRTISKQVKQINDLIKKVKNSKDIKETADISAMIQAKIAGLNAEKIQLDLYNSRQTQLEKVRQDRMLQEMRSVAYKSNGAFNVSH